MADGGVGIWGSMRRAEWRAHPGRMGFVPDAKHEDGSPGTIEYYVPNWYQISSSFNDWGNQDYPHQILGGGRGPGVGEDARLLDSMNKKKSPSDVISINDGVEKHISHVDHVSSRHHNLTSVNLLMLDAHATNISSDDLPDWESADNDTNRPSFRWR